MHKIKTFIRRALTFRKTRKNIFFLCIWLLHIVQYKHNIPESAVVGTELMNYEKKTCESYSWFLVLLAKNRVYGRTIKQNCFWRGLFWSCESRPPKIKIHYSWTLWQRFRKRYFCSNTNFIPSWCNRTFFV